MNAQKISKIVARVRSLQQAIDRDLMAIEIEINKSQVPEEPKQRRSLREDRIEEIGRNYATKWRGR